MTGWAEKSWRPEENLSPIVRGFCFVLLCFCVSFICWYFLLNFFCYLFFFCTFLFCFVFCVSFICLVFFVSFFAFVTFSFCFLFCFVIFLFSFLKNSWHRKQLSKKKKIKKTTNLNHTKLKMTGLDHRKKTLKIGTKIYK